jgi:hypothetical protein
MNHYGIVPQVRNLNEPRRHVSLAVFAPAVIIISHPYPIHYSHAVGKTLTLLVFEQTKKGTLFGKIEEFKKLISDTHRRKFGPGMANFSRQFALALG